MVLGFGLCRWINDHYGHEVTQASILPRPNVYGGEVISYFLFKLDSSKTFSHSTFLSVWVKSSVTCHFDLTSLLILGWSFPQYYQILFKEIWELIQRKICWLLVKKARPFLGFEQVVCFLAYFIHGVQVPFSGGNMCVITFLCISEFFCGSFANYYNFLV